MAWYETWFDSPYYHLLYRNRDYAEAKNFINALTDHLHLQQGATVVDLACGRGRHSRHLHDRGFNVYGLDLSPQSIKHNKQYQTAPEEVPFLRFAVHDMRDPLPVDQVDAVLSLFTSFGYFDKAADDEKVFQNVFRSLRQGGRFVLDFLNHEQVKSDLIPQEEKYIDGITFKLKREVVDQRIKKEITVVDGEKELHFEENVVLHTPEEIATLATESGFTVIDTFGNYLLEPYQPMSKRCIMIFKKL